MDTQKEYDLDWREPEERYESEKRERLGPLFKEVTRNLDHLIRVRFALMKAELAAAGPKVGILTGIAVAAHVFTTAALTVVLIALGDFMGTAVTGSFRSGLLIMGILAFVGVGVLLLVAWKHLTDLAEILKESADSNVHELNQYKKYRTASREAGELS